MSLNPDDDNGNNHVRIRSNGGDGGRNSRFHSTVGEAVQEASGSNRIQSEEAVMLQEGSNRSRNVAYNSLINNEATNEVLESANRCDQVTYNTLIHTPSSNCGEAASEVLESSNRGDQVTYNSLMNAPGSSIGEARDVLESSNRGDQVSHNSLMKGPTRNRPRHAEDRPQRALQRFNSEEAFNRFLEEDGGAMTYGSSAMDVLEATQSGQAGAEHRSIPLAVQQLIQAERTSRQTTRLAPSPLLQDVSLEAISSSQCGDAAGAGISTNPSHELEANSASAGDVASTQTIYNTHADQALLDIFETACTEVTEEEIARHIALHMPSPAERCIREFAKADEDGVHECSQNALSNASGQPASHIQQEAQDESLIWGASAPVAGTAQSTTGVQLDVNTCNSLMMGAVAPKASTHSLQQQPIGITTGVQLDVNAYTSLISEAPTLSPIGDHDHTTTTRSPNPNESMQAPIADVPTMPLPQEFRALHSVPRKRRKKSRGG